MLIYRIFLFITLFGYSWTQKKVDDCDKMACFVPEVCIDRNALSEMKPVPSSGNILELCDAILKMRVYSPKYLLIILECDDSRVTWITFEQGTTKFECAKDGSTVTAKFNDANMKLIRENAKKLSCVFEVKQEEDIFASPSEKGILSTSLTTVTTMPGRLFHTYCAPTCDPDAVKTKQLGAVGDKTVSEVEVQLAELVCPTDKKLTFRNETAPVFHVAPTNKITCKKNEEEAFEFDQKPLEARCEIDTCTQCNSEMAPSGSGLATYSEGSCTKLKCEKEGDWIKIGASNPVEGSAECKFENNKHIWKLKGVTIDKSTKILCGGKLKCFSTKADVEKICSDCEMGPNNLPLCPSNKTLMYKTMKMNVLCDDTTGKYFYNDGKINYTSFNEKLHCGGGPSKDNVAAASTSSNTGLYVGGGIGVVLAIGGGGVLIWWCLCKKGKSKEKKDIDQMQKGSAMAVKSELKMTPSEGNGAVGSLESNKSKQSNNEAEKTEQSNKLSELDSEKRRKEKNEIDKQEESGASAASGAETFIRGKTEPPTCGSGVSK